MNTSRELLSLRRLHHLMCQVHAQQDLAGVLQLVADGVAEVVGFQVAAVSYLRGDGLMEVVAVGGSDEARSQLLGKRSPVSDYLAEFAMADRWGALRFVPHERLGDGHPRGWVPELQPLDVPDAWHPEDALFATLSGTDGELVGIISVDLPRDGLRPGRFQREMLEMYAVQASTAIRNARQRVRLTDQIRLADAIREIAQVSGRHLDVGQVLDASVAPIAAGLRCERVAIWSFDGDEGDPRRGRGALFPESGAAASHAVIRVARRVAEACWARRCALVVSADDGASPESGGSAGSPGSAGPAGSAESPGSAGSPGSPGSPGSAESAGSAGPAGSAGSPGSAARSATSGSPGDATRPAAGAGARPAAGAAAGDRGPDVVVPVEETEPIRRYLNETGAGSVLLVPLDGGTECVGYLALTRNARSTAWTEDEVVSALEVGRDLGRFVLHARLFARERRLVHELQALDSYRSELFATISHEVKNPLTAIAGHTELLREEAMPAQEFSLRALERSTQRLRALVEDLLVLAKVADPKQGIEAAPVDMAGLLDEAAELLDIQARQRGVTVQVEALPGVVTAWGERAQLARMVENVVGNAIKYSPDGGTVSLGLVADGRAVAFRCRDEGLGISTADQGRLFTEFYRSSNPRAVAQPGTGLGLTIVKRIVERHGGSIRLDSRLGVGTTFTITVPSVAAVERAASQPGRASAR